MARGYTVLQALYSLTAPSEITDISSTLFGLAFFSLPVFLCPSTLVSLLNTLCLDPNKARYSNSRAVCLLSRLLSLSSPYSVYISRVYWVSFRRPLLMTVLPVTMFLPLPPTPTPTALLETTSPFDREDALQVEQRQKQCDGTCTYGLCFCTPYHWCHCNVHKAHCVCRW
ncbi:hypothetical protein BDV35DRAFT_64312 [Aspergillus flavus]|uniref:Uncharacterized protein n=1 Tax=Aspergillus flavus TaxID=5059 RepID=A0A5N6GI98_ASPFL|nr:hypothetical protein BDV35DRAFT_64312 [Aspergillus flavus]